MVDLVFPIAETPSVPVRGRSARYAVSRIFCVGRNYAAHAIEMGSDPTREPPFYFMKPANALLHAEGAESTAVMPYPPGTANLHFEMELVVALGQPVYQASPELAAQAIWGCACGLDMTRRDLQNEAKKTGRPWDLGKGFEDSAVIGDLVPVSDAAAYSRGRIELAVNGQVRQGADLADMIWNVPEIVANLSRYFHLGPGDLIYTGTPEGVGAVVSGDVIDGRIDGLGALRLTIGAAA
jgi:fumarylpyruvate hydrolase